MPDGTILKINEFRHYVEDFNTHDEELYTNIPNKDAWSFLAQNIPLLEIDDPWLEKIWYFRWWTYRKHVKSTPVGFVITEFLPEVSWAGLYNTISCPAAHHIYEGRWLLEPQYMDDYEAFWFKKGAQPRRYSFWMADSFYQRNLVHPNDTRLIKFLPDLIENYHAWEKGWKIKGFKVGLQRNGLFTQIDDRDGGEYSIGGNGFRPTLNAYMYGDAIAIAFIAEKAGEQQIQAEFKQKAKKIKQLVQINLWDKRAKFFKTLKRFPKRLVDVKELIGFYPWYFNLPDSQFNIAWKELMDPQGFFAPFGPTTAEQRHPKFDVSYKGHTCQWNGPSWPHATSIVLTAMANLLNNYHQDYVSNADYVKLLQIYAHSHQLKREDGRIVPWIDENLNPLTGEWLSRAMHKERRKDPKKRAKSHYERGKDYNHSTFNDLIITGLIGLRPRTDNVLEINPLVHRTNHQEFAYFCLDRIHYHHHLLAIMWDQTGKRYNHGKGLRVFCDGEEIYRTNDLTHLKIEIP